ncbi:MAG: hypothetical protein HY223_10455 [Thaumarchaeota archaeon]|nr:hypothetical protein [Nitrososphaerota archaeon]
MKTLQLSIIIIVIIMTILSIPAIFRTSSENDLNVTVSGLKDTYGIGEPITFFVEITSSGQNTIYPRAVIRNDSSTVWDSGYDLLPNGSKGTASVYYMSEYSNSIPMINQTGKYKLIVYYGELATEKDITIVTLNKEDGIIHYYGSYEGIDQETGTARIADQSYFIKTIHETPSDLIKPSDTKIEFHGISFTFPGCGSCLPVPTVANPPDNVDVQFPDQIHETLVIRDNMWPTVGPPIDDHQYFSNGTRIFPNGTKGTWTMIQHKDQIVTTLSTHTDPQAAITVTHDSVKLLVSIKNQTSSVPEFPFVVPILLISFVSVIIFYWMKFRK